MTPLPRAELAAAWRAVGRLAALPSRHVEGQVLCAAGAVTHLGIAPGRIEADVRDAGGAFAVRLLVAPPAEHQAARAGIIPELRDVAWRCACDAPEPPCGHAVAVWVAAGQAVAARPDLLSRLMRPAPPPRADAPPARRRPDGPQAPSDFWGSPPPDGPRPPFRAAEDAEGWTFTHLGDPPVGRGRMTQTFVRSLIGMYGQMRERAIEELAALDAAATRERDQGDR